MLLRPLRYLIAAPLAALHLLCSAAAPAPLLSDYTHNAWGAVQGAPVDVLKFAQGRDGWLWIATAIGLYRYDGVQFERTDSVYGHRLPSNNVLGLAVTADGAVWTGYRLGGISVFRPGSSRTYGPADGLPTGAVFHVEVAPDGAIWVGTRDGAARLAPGAQRFEVQGKNVNLPSRRVYQILFGRDGTQWVGTADGVFFRPPGQAIFSHAWPRPGMLASMAEGPDGAIWAVDTSDNYYRVRRLAPADGAVIEPDAHGTSMRFDRSGQMWLMQRDGLERKFVPGSPIEPSQRLTRQNGISGPLPQSSYQDREGNLWFGTTAGLDRLRPNRLKTLPVEPPFDHPGMLPGPDGSVWIGDYAGDIHSYTASGVRQRELAGHLSASYWAADGTLWLGNDEGLRRRGRDGRVTAVAAPAEAHGLDAQALLQERDGALWASFSGAGLFRLAHGNWTRDGALGGLPASLTTAMVLGADGTLWLGNADNIITQVAPPDGEGKRSTRRIGSADGLQIGTVLQLYRDGEHIWAGGEHGVALYQAGRFADLHGVHGETFRGISGIVRLPAGDLWLHGADGLYHIDAQSMAAWLAEPALRVPFERFDALDGLQGHAAQLRPVPTLIQGADGLLWLSTGSTIATLDPQHIRRNALAPPVQIESLTSDGVRHAVNGRPMLQLPEGSRNLQIAFTALSLSMPERVRLRYRLSGVDRQWQETGLHREASYTNLAPGNYRFEVVAANEDQVWNQQGAALEFRITPTFMETPWFAVLLALGGALLLYGAWALRVRHLTRRLHERLQERLQERLDERSRIARSLHDTLLQSVQALILSFHAHADVLPKGTRERARLDGTLNLADQLLIEGRDQIMDLRASASADELSLALQQFGKGLAEHRAHAFSTEIRGRQRRLQPRVHDEIYAIAREALFNASRYADAQQLTLELYYADDDFTLRVRDDGCGLDETVTQTGQRAGHWGLPGMRERASAIGASLAILSQPGVGTQIEVVVPGPLAY